MAYTNRISNDDDDDDYRIPRPPSPPSEDDTDRIGRSRCIPPIGDNNNEDHEAESSSWSSFLDILSDTPSAVTNNIVSVSSNNDEDDAAADNDDDDDDDATNKDAVSVETAPMATATTDAVLSPPASSGVIIDDKNEAGPPLPFLMAAESVVAEDKTSNNNNNGIGPPVPLVNDDAVEEPKHARDDTASSGLIIDDKNEAGPPLPFPIAAGSIVAEDKTSNNNNGLEEIRDEIGPPVPLVNDDAVEKPKHARDDTLSLTATAAGAIFRAAQQNNNGPEQITDNMGPSPRSAIYDDSRVRDRMAKSKLMVGVNDADVEEIGSLPRDTTESEVVSAEMTTSCIVDDPENDYNDGGTARIIPLGQPPDDDNSSAENLPNRDPQNEAIDGHGSPDDGDAESINEEGGSSLAELIAIPEAYLVDNEDVVISGHATPLPPWWKQPHARILISLVCVLVVVGFAIGMWPSSLSSTEASGIATTTTTTTTTTLAEEEEESLSPSGSVAPSFPPAPCSLQVSSSAQTLDLSHEDPYFPRVVADGRSALAVTRGSTANSAFHTVFFSLVSTTDDDDDDEGGGGWEKTSVFVDEDADQILTGGLVYASAISGRTALVGHPDGNEGAGLVWAYEQDGVSGLWVKMDEPLLPEGEAKPSWTWFGYSVDLDGDLACVAAALESAVYIFRRNRDDGDSAAWTQIDKLSVDRLRIWECMVAGNTVAVQTYDPSTEGDNKPGLRDIRLYHYDPDRNGFSVLQDPLPANSYNRVLSKDYLAFSATSASPSGDGVVYDGVSIYHQQDEHGPFNLHQILNSSDYNDMFGARLAIDGDILIVSATNMTVVFSERDGYWKEALVLDMLYLSYEVSDRNMFVSGFLDPVQNSLASVKLHNILSFRIQDCTQAMPTQMPSQPSSLISTTSSPPSIPCYLVVVEVVFDMFSGDTSWDIQKLSAAGTSNGIVIETHQGTWHDNSKGKRWSLCLQEGQYKFTIYDNGGDGICCKYGEGGYNITSSGMTIAEGGTFGLSETTIFPIPFAVAPSSFPSSSHVPSSPPTVNPSLSPSLSLSPTETCYWLEVSIMTDAYPFETNWNVSQIFAVDGIQEMTPPILVYRGGIVTIDFEVNGISFSGTHIDNSAIDSHVSGVICACGLGITQCNCRGKVCLIERGGSMFDEKVSNCELGGGLAAVIYNNGGETHLHYTLGSEPASIPAIFISQTDGRYLLQNGIGKVASVTSSPSRLLDANILNSHRLCLKKGQYAFNIHDRGGDGICCYYGEGRYNVTSGGKLLAQGGEFGSNECTMFSVPYISSDQVP